MLHVLASLAVRRARLLVAGVLVAVVGFTVVGATAFDHLQTEGFQDPEADSTLAAELLDAHGEGAPDLVFVVDAGRSVDSPTVAVAGTALTTELARDDAIADVTSYWQTGAPQTVSRDGTQALVVANLTGDDVQRVVDDYAGSYRGLEVTVGGPAVVGADIPAQVARDLAVAESIAVPVVLALLVLAFGSLVAALLPVIVGAIAIMGTFALLAVLGRVTDVSVFAINLTTGLGLALGIDYALLMVSRYREELARGRAVPDAVVRTIKSAGRTIVFSGLAVSAALAALLVFPLYFLRSFAYAGIGVVVIAMFGAVVALPALLALLGHRVNSGRLPWARSVTRGGESAKWGRLAGWVMRRPVVAAAPVMAVLLVAAAPLLQVSFGTPDDRVLPTSASSRQVGDTLRHDFGANDTTAIDVVSRIGLPPEVLSEYGQQLSMLPNVERVASSTGVFVAGDEVEAPVAADPAGSPGLERLAVVMASDPRSAEARDLVEEIRSLASPGGVPVLVGGETAVLADSLDAIADRLPLALGLIAVTTFVVLFLFTGSIVQPIRALLSTTLTLGATLGLMVLIFQEGHGSGLLGFTPLPLDMAMMVLLFCIVFGLSTDYEVFVMSRIKERHDAGDDVFAATVHGLTHTGRIVTVAAALIAVSFIAFATSQVSFIQLFGLGTGLAILLDATLIRGILVPASMRWFGSRSWYAPRPLRRLYARLSLVET